MEQLQHAYQEWKLLAHLVKMYKENFTIFKVDGGHLTHLCWHLTHGNTQAVQGFLPEKKTPTSDTYQAQTMNLIKWLLFSDGVLFHFAVKTVLTPLHSNNHLWEELCDFDPCRPPTTRDQTSTWHWAEWDQHLQVELWRTHSYKEGVQEPQPSLGISNHAPPLGRWTCSFISLFFKHWFFRLLIPILDANQKSGIYCQVSEKVKDLPELFWVKERDQLHSRYVARLKYRINLPQFIEEKEEAGNKKLWVDLVDTHSYCWFGILRVPLSNNPFHRGIPGIQTTGPQTNN